MKKREDCCFVCGKRVLRDKDDGSIFCGRYECLTQFVNEYECNLCGTPAKEFTKVGGMSLGRVTRWIYVCPNHSETKIIRFTFCPDVAKCPRCKDEVVGEIGVEFLKDFGYCLRCDNQIADAHAERVEVDEDE